MILMEQFGIFNLITEQFITIGNMLSFLKKLFNIDFTKTKSNIQIPKSAVVASKHGKETVIIPEIDRVFPEMYWEKNTFDTDLVRPIQGEFDTAEKALNSALIKATKAVEFTGAQVGIASESYIEGDTIQFSQTTYKEILVYVDSLNGYYFYEEDKNDHSAYSKKQIQTLQELKQFAKKVGFPENALTLKPVQKSRLYSSSSVDSLIYSGIKDWNE